VKRMNKGLARRARVRAVVAYPAVSLTLVVAAALALSSFGPTPVMALADSTAPIPTATASPTPTSTPSPVATSVPSPTATSLPSPTVGPVPSLTLVPGAAPGPVPAPIPSLTLVPGAALAPIPSLTLGPAAAPGDHHVLARIVGPTFAASYLPVDANAADASQFQTFRVRFQMDNAGAVPLTAIPQLEYRPVGGSGYLVVPEQPQLGIPLNVTREWVPNLAVGGGTVQGPIGADIAVADLRLGTQTGLAVIGHHSMGANPDQPITLPGGSYTEEEFTVQLTMDAHYLTGYQLRVTDKGAPLAGTDVATITLGPPPALRLSPGQRQGISEAGPKATHATTGVTYPLLPVSSTTAVSAVYRPNALNYPLTASTISSTTVASSDSIHGPYSATSDQCSVCHSVHTAQAPDLGVKGGSQGSVCFICHNGGGTGANTDVQDQYTQLTVNNPATGQYYSHDATVASRYTVSELNEFGGVANRISQCSNCHNAHQATTTDSVQTGTTTTPTTPSIGWTAPGALAGVSGVSVINGAAGSTPTYAFLDGTTSPVTLEYQLCFKCHSGFTNLLAKIPGKPSTDALDKGVEFNPNNASFHPIEAAGTNQTAAMNASLAMTGTSPYKMWAFDTTSTIRCLNCHASGTTPGPTPAAPTTQPPAAGGDLSVHTSSNQGILLRNYQDQVLMAPDAPYSAANFALCYACHAEAPFVATSADSTDTNFSLHGMHLNDLTSQGTATTDINTAFAGGGNAICAECHFRLHSTAYAVPGQTIDGSRLVNFAPDVTPALNTAKVEVISWTPNATGGGSCTLTCHGHSHTNAPYN
jgi:predicted CXXCH cytochrome family protein